MSRIFNRIINICNISKRRSSFYNISFHDRIANIIEFDNVSETNKRIGVIGFSIVYSLIVHKNFRWRDKYDMSGFTKDILIGGAIGRLSYMHPLIQIPCYCLIYLCGDFKKIEYYGYIL